jgi:hypothetical protein
MKIDVEIKGISPLLMNKFNPENLESKTVDKNETPREAAEKTAYIGEDRQLYILIECIFSCIICSGKFHKIGKNKVTTMKSSLIPAGISILSDVLPLNTSHFEVDSRAVVIPSTGGRIMKHRARLDEWKTNFSIEVDKTLFSEKIVRKIIDDAGQKIGLLDFRPDRKGYFGKFKVTKWECN